MLIGVTTGVGVGVVVKVEVEAAVELWDEVGVPEVEAAIGGGFGVRAGGGGLFNTCHFMRSRVATESSTEE